MPMASARPPRVIRLIVWPVSQSATTAASSANGMFSTTTITLRQSRRNNKHHQPHEQGPQRPSLATPHMARVT